MNAIKKKFLDLYKLLRYHDYLYYALNMPIISDEEYDFLLNKFYLFKKKHMIIFDEIKKYSFGFSKKYGYNINNHFSPMLSLENTFDINGYIKFHNNIKNRFKNYNVQFFCELKFDGVALSLFYKKGKLIRALTRGDGISGEDVTKNAFMIVNIPLILSGNIPELLEVRGEVCMLKKDFHKLNAISIKNKDKIFSNTRNAAAGSLRHKNAIVTKDRKLFFYGYSCNIISKFQEYYTHSEQLNLLRNLGFSTSQYILLSEHVNEIINFYYLMQQVRSYLSLNIDGVVVKVNSLELQDKIGYTSKFPRWALAIKFISQVEKTKLLSVNYQIGRTGVVTPVANLSPVLLSGAIIQKASLYNKNEMEKLNLFINDIVVVRRVGDVIPRICSVIVHDRLKNAKKVFFPKYCPSCSSLLSNNENNTLVQCLAGINCLDQKKKNIEHFFSKNGLYAEGFSTGLITMLVKEKYIKSPLDCFRLTVQELSDLKYFGEKSAFKIISSLKKCRKTTLSKFIYALGIPTIGVENANLITKHFTSLENIIRCTIFELEQIKHIGKICAGNFFDFMNEKNNIVYISKLIRESGIQFINNNKFIQRESSFFTNKKIVLTGKFKNRSRKDMIFLIKSLGGIIMNNISKNIDFLIVGKNPGKKVVYASQSNIKIILENNFEYFLNKS